MKGNREDLLLMVPVVCDFSSQVLLFPSRCWSIVGFTHNISISHFCEALFSIGWFIMM